MSGICAFFGHRDTVITPQLEERLTQTLRQLIDEGIDEFWCCEQGTFDWICRVVTLKLKKEFDFINVWYVCAYNPNKYSRIRQESLDRMFDGLIYNDKIARGVPRFAILRRNRYIVQNADVIVCYVEHDYGGAYQTIELAKSYTKRILNLAA